MTVAPQASRASTRVRSVRKRRAGRRFLAGGVVWIVTVAVLLAGVVAVNVAVLRAHVAVSKLDQKRAQLEAKNQVLRSALSAANSAPRVEAGARRLGEVPASAGNTSYLDLTPNGR